MHGYLDVKTLKNRSDFKNKPKWLLKVMCMNDRMLPFKLVSNEWDKVKCKGCPRKTWFSKVDF